MEFEHIPKSKEIVQLETRIKHLETKQHQPACDANDIPGLISQQVHNNHQDDIDTLKTRLHLKLQKHRFKLTPESFSTKVKLKIISSSNVTTEFKCNMTQIPVNVNDATTGHKLQGMSKDVVIVTSWPKGGMRQPFKNWECVVLSRVRTLGGLFLFEPIDMDYDFRPSQEFRDYIARAEQQEQSVIARRRRDMAKMTWD